MTVSALNLVGHSSRLSRSPPILHIGDFPYIRSQSAAHRAALVLSSEFEEPGFDLREQAGWNEAIAEHAGLPRYRGKTSVRPFVDVVLGYDDPAPRIVETNCLFDLRRNLNSDRIAVGRRMGNRQYDHET